MRPHPHVYVVAYDIADDKRLRRVYRTMRGYGDRVQYSVFVCQLTDLQRAWLESALDRLIHPTEDQVLFIPLGRAGARTTWRAWALGRPLEEPERVVRIV